MMNPVEYRLGPFLDNFGHSYKDNKKLISKSRLSYVLALSRLA